MASQALTDVIRTLLRDVDLDEQAGIEVLRFRIDLTKGQAYFVYRDLHQSGPYREERIRRVAFSRDGELYVPPEDAVSEV